ncbi:MAG: polysaccharide deacetylase family protein [Alistipes sp.]|nr:polysaccharide deacetylase family protein [Alistipes sp.]
MYWIVAIVVLCLILFMVWASADVGSNVYLRTLCRAATTERVVALTFDDGPDPVMTPLVLDTLRQRGVKATFFLVGSKVAQHPDIVRRIVEEGHTVGNHTHTHSAYFPLRSRVRVEEELDMCHKAIFEATGLKPQLFRPPFGVTNPIIGRAVRSRGYRTIGWSIRSLDTMSSRTRREVWQSVVRRLHTGGIILLHDRCDGAERLLAELIDVTLERGYRFESLDKMLNVDAYEN